MSLDVTFTAGLDSGSDQRVEVFDGNCTHNLNALAHEIGVYPALWGGIGILCAKDLGDACKVALPRLCALSAEDKLRLEPKNGWGSVAGFKRFLHNVIEAAEEHPNARVCLSC